MKKNNPMSRKDEIVVQELDGETLIYDLKTNKAVCLNETSALIWAACDGTRNVSEIGSYASAQLNAPVNDDLIWLALDQFKKESLLDAAPEENYFGGMSRREVIKKVSIGAAVAIPIVAGLLAPPIYAAGSACGFGCKCNGASTNGIACVTTGGAGVSCAANGAPGNCTICIADASTPNANGHCVTI